MLCSYIIAVNYEPKEKFEATYFENKSTFDT